MLRSQKQNDSLNLSNLNSSMMSIRQTTTQNMEMEVDNYTRRLEQDKRKYFRAQENYTQIKKDFETKNKQLEKLMSKQYKTQLITIKAKITTLEATLDQTINSYNQSLAKNNKLKSQIDELRKDKKNASEKIRYLNQKVAQIAEKIDQKKQIAELKQINIERLKSDIIKAKEQNQAEASLCESQIKQIQQNYNTIGKENDKKNKQQKGVKAQSIDTQPLLKLRLKNLIQSNKEKIKLTEQYKKHMNMIFENFEEIKLESGIQSLDEITNTFLKHQQQNVFICEYINRLNLTIDDLREGNNEITNKINEQNQINKQKKMILNGTPEQQKKKQQFQQFKQKKEVKMREMNTFLDSIKPKLLQVFKAYGIQNESIELSYKNIQSYLGEIQKLMNDYEVDLKIDVCEAKQIKEDMTKYTKIAPSINEENSIKTEERLLEQDKLKDIASQYWERKKVVQK